jgi:hypothetical protein
VGGSVTGYPVSATFGLLCHPCDFPPTCPRRFITNCYVNGIFHQEEKKNIIRRNGADFILLISNIHLYLNKICHDGTSFFLSDNFNPGTPTEIVSLCVLKAIHVGLHWRNHFALWINYLHTTICLLFNRQCAPPLIDPLNIHELSFIVYYTREILILMKIHNSTYEKKIRRSYIRSPLMLDAVSEIHAWIRRGRRD